MKIDFSVEVGEITIGGITFPIVADIAGFNAARPAPPCSNPDSPNYSDPGDDAEYDIQDVYILNQYDSIRDGRLTLKEKRYSIPEEYLYDIPGIDQGIYEAIVEEGCSIAGDIEAEYYEQMAEDRRRGL